MLAWISCASILAHGHHVYNSSRDGHASAKPEKKLEKKNSKTSNCCIGQGISVRK